MRIACLLVPDLPLAAELRPHPELIGRPLAVASGPGPRADIAAVSAEADGRGVHRSSSVALARAVCPELCVRVASPALERAARAALLDAALSFSPRAAPAPRASGSYAGEAAVYLDASGTRSLFPSEPGFAGALAARAQHLGLPAAVALASSRSVAHIAARCAAQRATGEAPTLVLPAGSESAFLGPLPIDLLDPDDALAEVLTRFGVRCVQDLLSLPRRALGTRLGPQGLRLVALARGEETEVPLPAPPLARHVEAIDLEFPIDRLEPLAFVLQGLLSRLLARLESLHLACGELTLHLELEGGGRDARRIGLAGPTLERRVWIRRLCHALEVRPPAQPLVGLAVETEGRAGPSDQLDFFRPAGPAPRALEQLLSELESLCGSDRIGAPALADTHHPNAFAMVPFEPRSPVANHPIGRRPAAHGRMEAGASEQTLALRALRPPVPVQVYIARGRPESIRSAVANGRVVRLSGPWRASGAWWSQEDRFAYESFDVQTSDGTVSRLRFDRLRNAWHIDAVYD